MIAISAVLTHRARPRQEHAWALPHAATSHTSDLILLQKGAAEGVKHRLGHGAWASGGPGGNASQSVRGLGKGLTQSDSQTPFRVVQGSREPSLGRPGKSSPELTELSERAAPSHLAQTWVGTCSQPGSEAGWAGGGAGPEWGEEVPGGGGGGDVTAQPLKDELFLPALQLPCSTSERRGPRAPLPDAGPGSDRPRCPRSSRRTRWVPAQRHRCASAGRAAAQPGGKGWVGTAGAEFGASSLPAPSGPGPQK